MKAKDVLLSVIKNQQWTSLHVTDYLPKEEPVKLDRPMTNEEYVEWENLACPFCRGDGLEWGSGEFGITDAHQEVSCLDCGAEWYDKYKLVGYIVTRRSTDADSGS